MKLLRKATLHSSVHDRSLGRLDRVPEGHVPQRPTMTCSKSWLLPALIVLFAKLAIRRRSCVRSAPLHCQSALNVAPLISMQS